MENSNYFNCENCPYKDGLHLNEELYKIRSSPLLPEINGGKTLLVFQSPGLNEWRTGRLISSTSSHSAAHKIESAFNISNKSRKDFDITNAVQCYTGKLLNNGITEPRDQSVSKLASKICSRRLQNIITKNQYSNLIVFGVVAKNSIEKISLPQNLSVRFSKHPSARGVSINMLSMLFK